MDEASRARIRVFLNDPSARGQLAVPSDPPRDTERSPWGFRVEADAPPPRAYEADTPEFLYWQIASALERGRELWSRLLPGAGTWIAGPVLPAVPIEGEGLDAYYDRKALHFFRDRDSKTGEVVHSGDSPDVVAHEQGHAILDALRPDLWDAPHFEVEAFHESFGDLSSVLVALEEAGLARAALEETGGSLGDSNLVSRLAEELAAAVRLRYGPGAALPGALRDAVNEFRYRPPRSLPDDGAAEKLTRQAHSFGRVLTGACWDALVRLYANGTGPKASEDDRTRALSKAARELGRFLSRAAGRAPSRAGFLRGFAAELVETTPEGSASRSAIREALASRDLVAADAERAERERREGQEALPTRLLDALRAELGASAAEEILVRSSRDGGLTGRRPRDLALSGAEYGPADGAAVEISDSFRVAVAESGYVTVARVDRAGPEEEEDAREFVRTLARRGRIAAEDTPIDSDRLYREGKSHFVVRERDGVRRVRRAWISGGRR